MTDPTDPAALDQAVIDTGLELAAAERAKPRDGLRVDAAKQAFDAAMAARYPGA